MEYIAGHAKFTGPKEVTVDGTKFTAEHILVATGTKPIIPSIPGDHVYLCVLTHMSTSHTYTGSEYGISSDGFFELEDLPK